MNAVNLMKFFVTGESGTTSLLATVLDPQFGDDRQRLFRDRFCNRLRASGVDISADAGPVAVLPEYHGMDLVIIWGDWILVLENKVAAASITRGQLAHYYRAALGVKRDKFLDATDRNRLGLATSSKEIQDKRICIVFLTPENSGNLEFKSLELKRDRTDASVHLSWRCVLADLEEAFPKNSVSDPLGRIIHDARSQTAEILREHSGDITVPETVERAAQKEFIRAVRKQVQDLMQFQSDLKVNIWRDTKGDQLYGHIGGDKGNVYLDVLADGVTDLRNKDEASVSGHILFKVAGKATAKTGKQFCRIPAETWERILDLDPESLTIDARKCSVTLERRRENCWKGTHDELAEQLAGLFCRFLLVFRPFMADQQEDK